MENFQTEEQQVEAIKNFWKDNGNSIIAGLLIGLGGFVGFNFYQEAKLSDELLIADDFMALQESAIDDPDAYTAKAQSFIEKNGESSYAALTSLALAKEAASHKDWNEAEKQLKMAVASAPDVGFAALANIRLARVQLQNEQIDAALATLGQTFPKAFIADVEITKGDAYKLQGKNELARAAYQSAIDNDGLKTHPNLQMKLDDLAEATLLVN